MHDKILRYYGPADGYIYIWGGDIIMELLSRDNLTISNIADAISVYNTNKYFAEGFRCKDWSIEQTEKEKSHIKEAKDEAVKFIKANIGSTIRNDIVDDIELSDEFIAIFAEEKLYNDIDALLLKSLITSKTVRKVLQYENLVKNPACNAILHDYLLCNNKLAFDIIKDDSMISTNQKARYHLSHILSKNEIVEICRTRLSSSDITLDDIQFLLSNKDLHLSYGTIKMLNGKRKELEESFFNEPTTIKGTTGFTLRFIHGKPSLVKEINMIEGLPCIDYNHDFIMECLTPEDFLLLFKNYFEFLTNGTIAAANRSKQFHLFEMLRPKFGKNYNIQEQQKIFLEMEKGIVAYIYEAMRKDSKSFEELLEDSFKLYLSYFGMDQKLCYDLLKDNTSLYKHRCSCISTVPESLLRKYEALICYSEIDERMISMENKEFKYSEMKSMVPDKYLVISEDKSKRDNIETLEDLLFSNQRIITIDKDVQIDDGGRVDSNYFFFALHNIRLKDIKHQFNMDRLKVLQSGDCVAIKEGFIKTTWKAEILRMLWECNAVSLNSLPEASLNIACDMLHKGELTCSSSFFTEYEYKWLEYLLKNTYGDGLALRNVMAHIGPGDNEDLNKDTYLTFLVIVITLTLKIIDELELATRGIDYKQTSAIPAGERGVERGEAITF